MSCNLDVYDGTQQNVGAYEIMQAMLSCQCDLHRNKYKSIRSPGDRAALNLATYAWEYDPTS